MLTENQNLPRAILAALDTQPGIQLAVLFGSLASGWEHRGSDVDLAIDVGHPLAVSERIALIDALAQRTGRPVDLVDLRVVGEPLLGQIIRYGKRLLGSETRYADLFVDTSSIRRTSCLIGAEFSLKGDRHGSGSNRAEARIPTSLSSASGGEMPVRSGCAGAGPRSPRYCYAQSHESGSALCRPWCASHRGHGGLSARHDGSDFRLCRCGVKLVVKSKKTSCQTCGKQ